VPFIGDPLTAVAGTLRLDLRIFTFWVIFGKSLRYLVLLGIAGRFLNYV
jgi:membrane protein YqaA with SNARE-associated domain